jgi:hypothetical protein
MAFLFVLSFVASRKIKPAVKQIKIFLKKNYEVRQLASNSKLNRVDRFGFWPVCDPDKRIG